MEEHRDLLDSTREGPSPVSQTVKNLPAMQETGVQSLGREDAMEKKMATHSSSPAWRTPWIEEPGGLGPVGSQGLTRLSFHFQQGGEGGGWGRGRVEEEGSREEARIEFLET